MSCKAVIIFVGLMSLPAFWGCGPNQTDGNQNTNVNDNQNSGDGGQGVARELTEDEANAVTSAARQTETLVATTSGASYARETEAVSGQATIQQLTTCPTIEGGVDAEEQQANVSLDFGSGCSPDLYPSLTFSGILTGTISLMPLALNLSIESFSTGGETVDGEIELSFESASGGLEFTADAILDFSDGSSLVLDTLTWTLETATGLVRVSGVGAGEDAAGAVYQIDLMDLVADGQGNGNFIPQEGSVTVTLPNDELVFAPDSTTIVVRFTAQTPAGGVVFVSVNGSAEFEYQTGLAP